MEMACISCTKLVDLIHQFLTRPQVYPRVHSRRWMRVTRKHRWVSQLSTKPLRGVAHSDPLVSLGGRGGEEYRESPPKETVNV